MTHPPLIACLGIALAGAFAGSLQAQEEGRAVIEVMEASGLAQGSHGLEVHGPPR